MNLLCLITAIAVTQTPARDDSALKAMATMIGGTWRGEVKDDKGAAMKIEFKYRRHPDGVGVVGEGVVGKGRKDALYIRSQFGWDPATKQVYYLDTHNSETVYFGHIALDKGDMVFIFGPPGGKPDAFNIRSRFTDPNTYASIIRDAQGHEIEGLKLHRS